MSRHTPPNPNDPQLHLATKLANLQRELSSLQNAVNQGGIAPVVSINAGWKNYGSGWQELGASRDSSGRVHLTGMVTPTSSVTIGSVNYIIGTLPEGWRPVSHNILGIGLLSSTVVCRIDCYTDGRIAVVAAGAGVSTMAAGVDYVILEAVGFQVNS